MLAMSNQPIGNHGLGIFSLDLVYYCFYWFTMFEDTLPARSGITLVIYQCVRIAYPLRTIVNQLQPLYINRSWKLCDLDPVVNLIRHLLLGLKASLGCDVVKIFCYSSYVMFNAISFNKQLKGWSSSKCLQWPSWLEGLASKHRLSPLCVFHYHKWQWKRFGSIWILCLYGT